MAVSARMLSRARKLKADAVTALLTDRYPLVCRLAHALTGRRETAARVVRHVMVRSVRIMDTWRSEDHAEQWFARYTIQTARRMPHPVGDEYELLLEDGKLVDPPYRAFVRALRSLPLQQQEAFLLHHGEKLNPRYVSVAMDSSTEATQVHLRSAEEDLKLVAGDRYPEFLDRLAACYASFTPTQQLVLPRVRDIVLTRVWPRRIARWLAWIVLLGLIAGAGYVAWWAYPQIET